jgi:hypothetical protein
VLLRAKAVVDRGCRLEFDMASYINMSRRLVRWMNRIRLPLTALHMRCCDAKSMEVYEERGVRCRCGAEVVQPLCQVHKM